MVLTISKCCWSERDGLAGGLCRDAAVACLEIVKFRTQVGVRDPSECNAKAVLGWNRGRDCEQSCT